MDLTSLFERARAAGRELLQLPVGRVDEILRAVADEALAQSEYILSENARDLERMSSDNPMYDRLKLTSVRLEGIAADTRHVAFSFGKGAETYRIAQRIGLETGECAVRRDRGDL